MGVLVHAGGDLGPLGASVAPWHTWVHQTGDQGETIAAIGNGFFGWEVVNAAAWQGNLVILHDDTDTVYFASRFGISSWPALLPEWSLFATTKVYAGGAKTYAVGLILDEDSSEIRWRLWELDATSSWVSPAWTPLMMGGTAVTPDILLVNHRVDIELNLSTKQIRLWHDGTLQFTYTDATYTVDHTFSLFQREITAGKSGDDLTIRYDHWIVNENGGPSPTGRLDDTYEVFGHRQHGADAIGGFADMNSAGAAALQSGGVSLQKVSSGGTYKWCATDGTPRSIEESITVGRYLSLCLSDVTLGGDTWTEQLFNSSQVTGIGSGDRILEVVIKDGTNPTAAEGADTVSICPVTAGQRRLRGCVV